MLPFSLFSINKDLIYFSKYFVYTFIPQNKIQIKRSKKNLKKQCSKEICMDCCWTFSIVRFFAYLFTWVVRNHQFSCLDSSSIGLPKGTGKCNDEKIKLIYVLVVRELRRKSNFHQKLKLCRLLLQFHSELSILIKFV